MNKITLLNWALKPRPIHRYLAEENPLTQGIGFMSSISFVFAVFFSMWINTPLIIELKRPMGREMSEVLPSANVIVIAIWCIIAVIAAYYLTMGLLSFYINMVLNQTSDETLKNLSEEASNSEASFVLYQRAKAKDARGWVQIYLKRAADQGCKTAQKELARRELEQQPNYHIKAIGVGVLKSLAISAIILTVILAYVVLVYILA